MPEQRLRGREWQRWPSAGGQCLSPGLPVLIHPPQGVPVPRDGGCLSFGIELWAHFFSETSLWVLFWFYDTVSSLSYIWYANIFTCHLSLCSKKLQGFLLVFHLDLNSSAAIQGLPSSLLLDITWPSPLMSFHPLKQITILSLYVTYFCLLPPNLTAFYY